MKYLKTISIFLIGLGLGLTVYYFSFPPFASLSSKEMHRLIVSHRDFAIKKATESGDYNCCVSPVCTMCYMEGNLWNNYQAGKCDCVSLIVEGKRPCPQCERALVQSKEETCVLGTGEECSLK